MIKKIIFLSNGKKKLKQVQKKNKCLTKNEIAVE